MYKLFSIILIIIGGCHQTDNNKITNIVSEWQNKKITFPTQIIFNNQDSIPFFIPSSKFKILVYIDSAGCTSCKLQLPQWKEFIHEVDSITGGNSIPFLLFFNAKNYKEISYYLQRDEFHIPVCFDKNDSLNKLNHFPSDIMFQTFLLDSNNNVNIIGNPIRNSKIKELYLKTITEKKSSLNHIQTSASIINTEIDLGRFEKENTAKGIFKLKNIGENPLIIAGVNSSCGCISTYYDKHPIGSGDTLNIIAEIKTETEGYFEKTLMVHCNTNNSPITLKIKGRSY